MWTHEQELILPYSAYLDVSDLDTLYRLVLSTTIPEAVEESFYRILEDISAENVVSDVSVRRETEMRILIAASAVMAGRNMASVEDLDVITDCLWDTPTQRPRVKRIVDEETGAYRREMEMLRQTVIAWDHMRSDVSYSARLSARAQIASDLRRVEEFAARSPDDADAAALAAEARQKVQEFESAIFDFDGEGDDRALGARNQEPTLVQVVVERPHSIVTGMRVVTVGEDEESAPAPLPALPQRSSPSYPVTDNRYPVRGLRESTDDAFVAPYSPPNTPSVDAIIDATLGTARPDDEDIAYAHNPPGIASSHDDPWDTLSDVDQPQSGPILLLPSSNKSGGDTPGGHTS
jgi:hypothetical protein